MTTHFGFPVLEKALRALGCWSFGVVCGLSVDIFISGHATAGDLGTSALIAAAAVAWCWSDWD